MITLVMKILIMSMIMIEMIMRPWVNLEGGELGRSSAEGRRGGARCFDDGHPDHDDDDDDDDDDIYIMVECIYLCV